MSDTIRDIVRRGQDILAMSRLGLNRRTLSDYWTYFPGFHSGDTSRYPQSLGELCIEISQDEIAKISDWRDTAEKDPYCKTQDGMMIYGYFGLQMALRAGDIQQLKQAMWHKHTDYTQEVAQKWWEESVKIAEKRGKK
jgi:hypothetical protein